MSAGRAAIDTKLMLQANDIDAADIEKVRSPQVGREIFLVDLEAYEAGRIFVAFFNVIDRYTKAMCLGIRRGDGGENVSGECGNAALARKMIADEGDFMDL